MASVAGHLRKGIKIEIMKLSATSPHLDQSDTVRAASPVSTSIKGLKVLLYGNIQGANYRSQTLIKFLLDSRYAISLVLPNFYLKKGISKSSLFAKFLVRLHLIEFLIKAAFADVIYLLPLNNSLITDAVWVSKLLNKKLVAEIHVSLYDTFIEEKEKFKGGSQKAKLEIHRDRLALTRPDYVISTSCHESGYWEKNLAVNFDRSKFSIAPIFSSSTPVHKREFMQDGVLRICWWGTFVPLHGLDKILQAMKLLKEKEIRFTCNLFGIDNPSSSVYAAKIHSDQLDSHVFLRKDLTFFDDSLPQYLVENCDLALGIFGSTGKAYNAVPTKLVEALSMGIPTLTMKSPALAEFFDPKTDLWSCEPLPVSMAEMIMEIINGRVHSVNWNQTRQKVLSIFSTTQYQKVVSQILGEIADNVY